MELDKMISVYPFNQFGFYSLIQEREWQVDRKGGQIELTESTNMESPEHAKKTLEFEGKRHGARQQLTGLGTESSAQQPQRGAWKASSGSHVQQIQALPSTSPACTFSTEMPAELRHLFLQCFGRSSWFSTTLVRWHEKITSFPIMPISAAWHVPMSGHSTFVP